MGCEKLGLNNTFLIGARGQDQLAEMYTVSQLGCFPSFKEPFGLVFVECMACLTPVIGANSGGPKDFVTLGQTLAETIGRALDENWKASKGFASLKLAHDKFTVKTQVTNMLTDVKALPVL